MAIPNRTFRAALLTLAFALSGLTLHSTRAAECTPPAHRYVWRGECCGISTQKKYGQACIQGTWVDDGSTTCSSPCPV